MKSLVQDLFAEAGVIVNGSAPWDIVVNDDVFYRRLIKNPELSLAEMYMDGLWECLRLDQFIYKVLAANLEEVAYKHPKFWLAVLKLRLFQTLHRVFNFQTKQKSFEVGKVHYDIGNDLYQAMLDKRLVYTCGYWLEASNLDQAQEHKLKLTCEKLNLQPGQTLLDIGCGFGSLAKYAAEHYQVSVVGLTISKQQYEFAKQNCAHLPVDIRFQDYRDLLRHPQKFDRIASLGMFEHVGYKNYEIYMDVVSHALKEDGIFLLHTIGGNSSQVTCANQFVSAYIFPNGMIPSITQIGAATEKKFVMEDWHNFGVDYDKTLMAWYHNFNDNWQALQEKYDERFRRMWNYYLLSCAASFRGRHNQLWQIVLSKQGLPQGFVSKRY